MQLSSAMSQVRRLVGTVRERGPAARLSNGRSLASQLKEILKLRFGPGRLSPQEYYQYQLYDDARFDATAKAAFISDGAMPRQVWAKRAAILADDKAVFYTYMDALGQPTPRVIAYFHGTRQFGKYPTVTSVDALVSLLSGTAEYPVVIKPVDGIYSRDVLSVLSYDGAANELRMSSGDAMSMAAFAEFARGYLDTGLIVQERLSPAARIAEIAGDRLCTVRMIVLRNRDGARLHLAIWKIAGSSNMADNYWREGNSMAPIDLDSGKIGPCITGMGAARQIVETHPDTGTELAGTVLPDWQEAKTMCLSAAACIPGIPIQAWDVALTDQGPLLLEVNIVGSLFLPQLAHQAGLLTPDFADFLSSISDER